MAGVKELKERIRSSDSRFARTVRRARRAVYEFSIRPVGPLRPAYRALYWTGHGLADVARRLAGGLLWKPLFIARCARVGKALQLEVLPYVTGSGSIEIGDNVDISGRVGIAFNDRFGRPTLRVGNRVFIGHGCNFSIAKEVEIGDDTLLAGGTGIVDNDGHPMDPVARRDRLPIREEDAAPVSIGRNVWVGAGCLVMKGVRIGDNSVIGARSIVTRDVPANSVAVGSPARVIRQLEVPGADGPAPSQSHKEGA